MATNVSEASAGRVGVTFRGNVPELGLLVVLLGTAAFWVGGYLGDTLEAALPHSSFSGAPFLLGAALQGWPLAVGLFVSGLLGGAAVGAFFSKPVNPLIFGVCCGLALGLGVFVGALVATPIAEALDFHVIGYPNVRCVTENGSCYTVTNSWNTIRIAVAGGLLGAAVGWLLRARLPLVLGGALAFGAVWALAEVLRPGVVYSGGFNPRVFITGQTSILSMFINTLGWNSGQHRALVAGFLCSGMIAVYGVLVSRRPRAAPPASEDAARTPS